MDVDDDEDLWGEGGGDSEVEVEVDDEQDDGIIDPTLDDDNMDIDPSQPTDTFDNDDSTTRLDLPSHNASHSPSPLLDTSYTDACHRRRLLFLPSKHNPDNPALTAPAPQHLSLDPIVVIPQPTHIHSMTATPCLTYLLTGSDDGHARIYDFWASANGKNLLSVQQRAVANLGEGVNKGPVIKGFWRNEVEVEEVISQPGEEEEAEKEKKKKGAAPVLPWMQGLAAGVGGKEKEKVRVNRVQPVYSVGIQEEGLWAVTGTDSGVINLTTIRHDPGKIAHVFQHATEGHKKAVSTINLTNGEAGMITGSWDYSVKEWDLNTGQVVRTFTKHKGQISSVQLLPIQLPSTPEVLQRGSTFVNGTTNGVNGEDASNGEAGGTKAGGEREDAVMTTAEGEGADEDAAGSPDSYGSLFGDEDEDGEGKKDDPAAKPPSTARPAPPAPPPATISVPPPSQPPLLSARPGLLSASIPGRPGASGFPTPLGAGPGAGRAVGLPPLTPTTYKQYSDDVMLVTSLDGEVALHDRRVGGSLVGKLESGPKTPPWCMSACFSADGKQVIAGRRNASVDVWDIRKSGFSGTNETPNLLRTLKHPVSSQMVTAVAAFPDGKHIACASIDCVRLWNTADLWDPESNMKKTKSGVPFRIVAGHHGGTVSKIHIDPTGKFMITSSGNRGWSGETTKVVIVHETKA